MSETNLKVIAVLRGREDKADELKELLLGLVEPTRAEEGCVKYDLLQDNESAAVFVFDEEWTSEEALQQHLESDHVTAAFARFDELLEKEPDLYRYTLLA